MNGEWTHAVGRVGVQGSLGDGSACLGREPLFQRWAEEETKELGD